MSTPKTLDIPAGVDVTTVTTDRGTFAAHTVRSDAEARGHVLLVPGWTGSKEDFTPLLPLLAQAGFNPTAYDQRGQYQTAGADSDDYTLAGWAADAAAIAAAISVTPVHLLGHSFGGLVAQQAAVAHTDAWSSLSLLCTGPGALGESPDRPLSRLIDALESDTPMDEIVDEVKGKALANEPADIAAFVHDKFEQTSRASLAAMTSILISAPDITADVRATDLPTWMGHGEDDDAWPLDVQADQARRLGIDLVVIPDSAHSPAIENPIGLADAWIPFLEKC